MDQPPHLDPERLRQLSQPAIHRWLLPAAIDWAAIVGIFALVGVIDHPLAYALAVLPLGSRQQALGALFHDAAHRLASRRPLANELAGNLLAAWPLGLSLGGYRRYHFAHHRHLGTAEDPEMSHKRLLPQWALPASPLRVARDFASDLVGGGLPHLLAAGGLTRPVSVIETTGMIAFWAAVSLVAWRAHALWVPVLWIVSIATVFWSGVRLRIWTEHLGTKDTHRIHVPAWLAHLIMPHDIGLHWEHHRWPSVPFWNLARIRALVPHGELDSRPLLSLGALLRGFLLSAPLASGEVGVTIGERADTHPTPDTARSRSAELDVLKMLIHVALPFVSGVLVYLTCRRVLPRALAWFPAGGLLAGRVPSRFVDVFPDFVWSYALAALLTLVWSGSPSRARWLWIGAAPLLTAGWEIGQYARVVPGTFDPADLVFGVAACGIAVLLCSVRLVDLSTAADPPAKDP